uniref:A-type flavoprotein n=1 Tax=Entamoeba moshkovskii TaxID=41668 RepID=Q2PCA8_9EUKA|nr:A-type flavoprotein [Entamoeba moshkovskii]
MAFKALEVVPNLYWVGVLDYDLKVFDIVMTTPYGTSYNSFLLKTEKGNVLFETCKESFAKECIERIEDVIGKEGTVDYIVLNHTEPDHSGSLVNILERYPEATVVATVAALNNIKYIGHITDSTKTISSVKVKTLDLGNYHLKFLIQPFLHWPDTMMTVIEEMRVIVTCDMFGAHYCDPRVFNDQMEDRMKDMEDSYKHYFDCIFHPFKQHVMKGLNMIETQMGFPVEELKAICCSHGPVLRTNIKENIERYKGWAQPTVLKNKVVIAYGSAYGYTEMMAQKIAEGIKSVGVEVTFHNVVTSTVEAVLKDFEDAKGLLLGTPTIVGDAIAPIMMIACNLNPIVHCNRYIQCFGSHGWSGEGVKNVSSRIQQLKVKQPVEPLAARFKPTGDELKQCVEWGVKFAEALKA